MLQQENKLQENKETKENYFWKILNSSRTADTLSADGDGFASSAEAEAVGL